MALRIANMLNIEQEERGIVFLLLTQSVFLGIFAGALDVGANALFLEHYRADLIPRAFMLSGIVGILFTSLYTFFQPRIRFKLFVLINLVLVILITGILWFGFRLVAQDWLAFAVFVMMGPLIIVSMLGFWGTAGRYFTLREGKRLFGVIDTGSVIGMILAFYAVPVLLQFDFRVENTLLIGFLSLVFALFFQLIIINRYAFKARKEMVKPVTRKTGFLDLFKNRYTTMMALFVVLSVVTAFFIHYSFLWVTESNYTDSRERASFIGAFFGTMMVFTIIVKSTLYGWMMKNYGLRVALLVSPVLLLVMTVIAAIVGGAFGFAAEAASFTFFFLVISLSKLFNKSLKDAIEGPSMKILYQSLDSSVRYDVQARIDGVVNELTAFSAGLLMSGLLVLDFIKIIHFSYILIAILVAWVILGISLYRSYRHTLNASLSTARSVQPADAPLRFLDIPAAFKVPMVYEMMHVHPYFYHIAADRGMDGLLESEKETNRLHAWEFIQTTLFGGPDDLPEKVRKSPLHPELERMMERYEKVRNFPGGDLNEAFHSSDEERVLAALYETVRRNDRSQVPNLIMLLRARDRVLRAAAIEAAGKMRIDEMGSYLVETLGDRRLYAVTWSSLVKMGEAVIDNLENLFHKTGVDERVQVRTVRAMAAIGGEKAQRYMLAKTNYHQRDVREAAVNGLFHSGYQADASSRLMLEQEIFSTVEAGAWNIAAEYTIRENDPENGLLQAIREEIDRNNQFLFELLGITYDRHAIGHIRENLREADNQDSSYALELMNLVVDDQVKSYLEPYFDDRPVPDKIRQLQVEMPVEILSYGEVLRQIIVRDGLYLGTFIRACAIEAAGRLEDLQLRDHLAAQVFHPEPVIVESAAAVLTDRYPEDYGEISARVGVPFKDILEQSGFHHLRSAHPGIKLVLELKQWPLFRAVPLESLLRLARLIRKNGETDLRDLTRITYLYSTVPQTGEAISNGWIAVIPAHSGLAERIEGFKRNNEVTIYQTGLQDTRILLFDDHDLLNCFARQFGSERDGAEMAGLEEN